MHPAPSLAEAPPTTNESRPGHNPSASPASHSPRDSHGPGSPSSPPVRKDTTSSTSTIATTATLATGTSGETAPTVYGNLEASPNFTTQAVFSVKDGADAAANRRASRRRTGPLSAVQRERAALIRKLGACSDCRRRRVAVSPIRFLVRWNLFAHHPLVPPQSPQHDLGRCRQKVPVSQPKRAGACSGVWPPQPRTDERQNRLP